MLENTLALGTPFQILFIPWVICGFQRGHWDEGIVQESPTMLNLRLQRPVLATSIVRPSCR